MSLNGTELIPEDQNDKNSTFSRTFSLPNEELVDDFSCALLKSSVSLFHGRMFVSKDHICFYSNFFNNDNKTLVIAFADVVDITKKNTVWVVPNAIEITLSNGTVHFFGSFLSRNRCFQLLHDLSGLFDSFSIPSESNVASHDSTTSQSSAIVAEVPGLHSTSHSRDDETPSLEQAEINNDLSAHGVKEGVVNCTVGTLSDTERAPWNSLPDNAALEFVDLGQCEFPIPTTQVFQQLYGNPISDCSVVNCLKQLQASKLEISPWQEETGYSMRKLSMVIPVNSVLTTIKETRIEETCCCTWDPSKNELYFRSQTQSLDVPYGDGFVVVLAYDFVPNDSSCIVHARVAVRFLRSIWMMKPIIVQQSVEGTRNAFKTWSQFISSKLAPVGTAISQPQAPMPPGPVVVKSPKRTDWLSVTNLYQVHVKPLFSSVNLSRHLYNQSYLWVLSLVSLILLAILSANMASQAKSSSTLTQIVSLLTDMSLPINSHDSDLHDLQAAAAITRALCISLSSRDKPISPKVLSMVQDMNGVLREWISLESASMKDLRAEAELAERMTTISAKTHFD